MAFNNVYFTIPNGLQVNTSLLLAGNGTVNVGGNLIVNGTISINTATINSTFFSQSANNSYYLNGNSSSFVSVGNSTQNVYVNSSGYYLNGTLYSNFSNGSNITVNVISAITGINTGSNVYTNTSAQFVGNSTQNTIQNSTGFYLNGTIIGGFSNGSNITVNVLSTTSINTGSNVYINTSGYFVGNSTQNVYINSTGVFVNGVGPDNGTVSNNQNVTFNILNVSSNVIIGSNVYLNAVALVVGNTVVNSSSFILGNTTVYSSINSTAFYTESYQTTVANVVLAGTTAQLIDSWPSSNTRSVEYRLQVTDLGSSSYHRITIYGITDGTSTFITEFGDIYTNTSLATFTANLAANGYFVLWATPSPANSAVKVLRTLLST